MGIRRSIKIRRRKRPVNKEVEGRRRITMKSLEAVGCRMRCFKFEDGFVEKVMKDITNPHIHREINKPSEVCGAFYVKIDPENGDYIVCHDASSVLQANPNGFSKGTYDPDDNVQFCHPRKYSANILWHSHPKGVPAYPSGSDVFVTMVRDCSTGLDHIDTTAQAYIEMLFTEHGFWLIHRNIYEDGRIAGCIPIDTHEVLDINSVRDHVATLCTLLETKIINHYYRTPVPDDIAVQNIQYEIDNNPVFHPIKDRVKIKFYPWNKLDSLVISLPEALVNAPVRGVCVVH